MVNAIEDLPPVALTSGTNFQPLFQQANDALQDKSKVLQKTADNEQSNKGNSKNTESNKKTDTLTKTDYSKLSEKLKEIINEQDYNLQFSVDEQTKKMIIKVIDSKTNEVIRQYPPDVTLKIARFVASTLDNENKK